MALPAFANARPAAIDRYLPPAGSTAANPLLLLLIVHAGTDRRTDGHRAVL